MLWLAHEAAIASDWVAHYAVRMAAHTEDRRLQLVHVSGGGQAGDALTGRLAHLEAECRRVGVALGVDVRAPAADLGEAILSSVPSGAFVVCGIPGGAVAQRGSVSAGLLRARRHHVLALRVAQPGVLGHPMHALLPVRAPDGALQTTGPWLRLLAPNLEALHVLHVDRVSRLRFRLLSDEGAARRLRRGREWLEAFERRLAPLLAGDTHLDGAVVVSDDVPKEVVIQADRLRARLILFGLHGRPSRRPAYGAPIRQVLREARADVAVCGAPR